MSVINVILSGGVGSRLWPLSRKNCPKQYIKLFNGKSLFELTIERNFIISDKILVVANKNNNELTSAILNNIQKESRCIIETVSKNTAPAIAFAAFASDPDDILLVTPSDHMIEYSEEFTQAINRAIAVASEGYLVTFGINPTRPETGYGYIEFKYENVLSFREKPDLKTAKQFILSENFLWNSGMFCFKAKVFLEELKKFTPELYLSVKETFDNSNGDLMNEDLSLRIPSISVDYAVFEKSDKLKVVKSNFNWTDLGSFEALHEYFIENGYPKDNKNNIVIGTEDYVGFIGLENTILVKTNGAILVVNKEYSQDVKLLYELIEQSNSELL